MSLQPESTAALFTWVLEKLFSPLVDQATDTLMRKKWEKFDAPKAEAAYREKIRYLYGTTRVLGRAEEVSLDNIFTDLYILDKPTAYRRYNISSLLELGEDRTQFQKQLGQRELGIGWVAQGHNLYILGKPGAGKTTFLQHVALQAANLRIVYRLPIFVSLHEWANSEHNALMPFIIERFDICDFPDAGAFVECLLKEGKAILLFDGLDEVRQEGQRRQQLTRLLHDFTRKYDQSQHLITCRIAASDYRFSKFRDVEVADFTPAQVDAYVEKWFGKESLKHKAFQKALAETQNQGIRELCNSPLLLSLICLYFDENMIIPPRRAELYEDALDALLRKWDGSRSIERDTHYKNLVPRRKQQLLARLAMPAFDKGQHFFRTETLATQIADYLSRLPDMPPADEIDGEAVLRSIAAQHGLLIERAKGIYAFSHLTFQEYFTARYIVENEARGRATALAERHLSDKRWREVFLLTASLLEDGDDFCDVIRLAVDQFIAKNSRLVALLTWSHERTEAANPQAERWNVVQLAYIILALALTHAHSLTRAHVLARELDHTITITRTITRALGHALDHALALSRVRNVSVGFDYGLYYSWTIADTLGRVEDWERYKRQRQEYAQAFPTLLDLAERAGETKVHQKLQNIQQILIPSAGGSAPAWQRLADELAGILEIECGLQMNWDLSDDDTNQFNDYLYANQLLVQCLKLASVSDRQGRLNGLLLPPVGVL